MTLTAINRMLPGPWAWQYLLAELLSEDGSATKSYPIIIDRATDQGRVGEASGRMVEMRLR